MLVVIGVMLVTGGILRASVSSVEEVGSDLVGWPHAVPPVLTLPLTLTADAGETIAGVNGQLNYDPTFFENPTVAVAGGAGGFTVLGNEVAPGEFRFVVYANPTQTMTLETAPIVNFRLNLKHEGIDGPVSTQITYSMEAAATPEGVSLADVGFKTVSVELGVGARDWILYR